MTLFGSLFPIACWLCYNFVVPLEAQGVQVTQEPDRARGGR